MNGDTELIKKFILSIIILIVVIIIAIFLNTNDSNIRNTIIDKNANNELDKEQRYINNLNGLLEEEEEYIQICE